MTDGVRLTTAETVHESRSWLFTVRDPYDELDEVVLVPCEDEGDDELQNDGGVESDDGLESNGGEETGLGVQAWVNRCTHEAQRLDRGFGAALRDGQIICPKHGSMFDTCSGYCDNGEAADTTLVSVDVAVEDGAVYLTDDDYDYVHEGSIEDGGDGESDAESGESDGNEVDDGESATGEGSETGEGNDEDDDDDMPSSTSHIGF